MAKRVERVVVVTTGIGATPLLDAWNACEKGSDRAMMMVAVKEADLMVVLNNFDILFFEKCVSFVFSPRKPTTPSDVNFSQLFTQTKFPYQVLFWRKHRGTLATCYS